jgi:hypothetical protein
MSLKGNAGTCQVPCNGIGRAQPWKAVYIFPTEAVHAHGLLLKVLKGVTNLLRRQMHYFATITCPEIKTVKTDSEYAARLRAATCRDTAKVNMGPVPVLSNLPNMPGKNWASMQFRSALIHTSPLFVLMVRMTLTAWQLCIPF